MGCHGWWAILYDHPICSTASGWYDTVARILVNTMGPSFQMKAVINRTIGQKAVRPLLWRHNGRDGDSNHQPHDCLHSRLFMRRSKKTPKLHVTDLCVGNSPGTGEFPAQMASNAENVSIWWRRHAKMGRCRLRVRTDISVQWDLTGTTILVPYHMIKSLQTI